MTAVYGFKLQKHKRKCVDRMGDYADEILVEIEYDGEELQSVVVDGREMADIDDIKREPIERWFSQIMDTGDWKGLQEEVWRITARQGISIRYKFNGPEESKKIFEKIIGTDADGFPLEEMTRRNMEYAKGCERAKDFKEAFQLYKKAADEGNLTQAQKKVAQMYYGHVQGALSFLPITKEEAGKQTKVYFEKAAGQGDMDSQLQLYHMFSDGIAVEQNWEEALKWLKEACEQKDDRAKAAMYEYARCCEYGKGIKQDYEAAFFWYRKASVKNECHAQLRLGRYYEIGCGTEADLSEAEKWYEKAKENGLRIATFYLKQCKERR